MRPLAKINGCNCTRRTRSNQDPAFMTLALFCCIKTLFLHAPLFSLTLFFTVVSMGYKSFSVLARVGKSNQLF